MNVAIVQEHVDPHRGGAETSVIEMARHLAATGVGVTIICRRQDDAPFVRDNVTYMPVRTQGSARATQTFRFVQDVHALCKRERFDIVHAVTPCLSANVYQPRGGTYRETVTRTLARVGFGPWRALKHFGRRFNVRQQFLTRIEQTLLVKNRHRVFVAAVSEYVAQQVEREGGFPRARLRVVFNGVETPALDAAQRAQERTAIRERLGLDNATPLILFVAHNFKLKGLAELLRAVARGVQRDGADWVLAVAGRDAPGGFAGLARRLEIERRVRFVGPATPIHAWYAAADVLAHPTWYDPCSRVVLEALSVGLPVVTTRYNGASEAMQAGRDGVVIDEPRDSAALATGLTTALRPELRAACAAAAPEHVERLSMARHARDLRRFYRDVLRCQATGAAELPAE
jgi:UDP-glucose:(heptosyl)LPS alpha-1,3-glucosyltransferase